MKRIAILFCGLIWVTAVAAQTTEVSPQLQSEVEACFQRLDRAMESKDIDLLMESISDDYMSVFYGPTAEGMKRFFERRFEEPGEARASREIEAVERIGDLVQVRLRLKIEHRDGKDKDWRVVADSPHVYFLAEEEGSLRIRASGRVSHKRYGQIEGQTYNSGTVGFSLTVPKNWVLIPTRSKRLMEAVAVLSPDGSSAVLFGYIEPAYNLDAGEALKADDSALRQLAGDNYRAIASKTATIAGLPAYESHSEFTIDGDSRSRRRMRIYLTVGGLLYTFNCDAVPPQRWEKVEPEFRAIVESFTLSETARTEGLRQARRADNHGLIAGNQYSNKRVGCKITAPEGWRIARGKVGDETLFTVNVRPPETVSEDSLVRFLAVETGGPISLREFVQSQIENIEKIGSDAESSPIERIKISGLRGKKTVQQFSLEGLGSVKRKSAFFLSDQTLYMFLCDAIPPSDFEALEPDFDRIIRSFTLADGK